MIFNRMLERIPEKVLELWYNESSALTGNIDCANVLRQMNFHAPVRRLRQNTLFYLPTHRTHYIAAVDISMKCMTSSILI